MANKKRKVKRHSIPTPVPTDEEPPTPKISIWSRLKNGATPPADYQAYSRCILSFLVLCAYLSLGGVFLWVIERNFEPVSTESDEQRDQLHKWNKLIFSEVAIPPKTYIKTPLKRRSSTKRRSSEWTIFDGVFVCYSIASGSGPYSDLRIETTMGKLFVFFYALFGCPLIVIVLTYMSQILNAWANCVTIIMGNLGSLLIDSLLNTPPSNTPKSRSQSSLDDNDKNRALCWPVAVFYFIIYWTIGSWLILYHHSEESFFNLMYASFSAFVTLEVPKEFNVPARGIIHLVFLLFGIAAFQLCIESIRESMESVFFDRERRDYFCASPKTDERREPPTDFSGSEKRKRS